MPFLEGFTLDIVAVADGNIGLRHGGAGPPPLPLHGNRKLMHKRFKGIGPILGKARLDDNKPGEMGF